MIKLIFFILILNTFYPNVFCQIKIGNVQNIVMGIGMKIFMDSSECAQDIRDLIKGAKNYEEWALSMLDASGKLPQGLTTFNLFEIGNFDNCITLSHDLKNRTIEGKHCMGSIAIPKKVLKMAFKDKEVTAVTQDLSYEWGLCAPKTCNASQLNSYFGDLIEKLTKIETNITFADEYCRTNDAYEFDNYDIAIIIFFTILILVVFLSTAYEIYIKKLKKEGKPNQVILEFSLYKNGKSLLKVSEVDDSKPMFYSINGLKVFLMSWVLYVHVAMDFVYMPSLNFHKFVEFTQEWRGVILIGAVFTIDGFLFISGFLCAYQYLQKSKGELKLRDIPKYIFERYMRLMPVILATSMLMILIGHITNASTIANRKAEFFIKDCEDNWWTNHLTIQNFYNPENMCNSPTWYATVDFHYFLITLFVLLIGGYYNILLYVLPVFLIIASTASAVATCLVKEIPAMFRIGEYDLMRKYIVNLHIPTQQRAAPFFIGVIFGYYIWKRSGQKLKFNNKMSVFLCWTATLILLIGTYLSVHYFAGKDYKFSSFIDPAYTGVHRIIFTAGFALLFILCEYGNGSILERILKFKYFQIYSKLTYSVYIIQAMYLYIFYTNQNTLVNYSQFSVFEKYVSIHVTLLCLAAVMYLFVEAPFSNLARLITKTQKKKDNSLENGRTITIQK